MSLDLNQLLDLPNNFNKIKLMSITGDDLNNGSFLIHSLISSKVRCCRNRTGTDPFLILILLNHSYSHYSSVAAKSFGLNLKALRDSGQLVVIDIISNLREYLDSVSRFDFNKFLATIHDNLSPINRSKTDEGSGQNPLIIIDDISVLLSLQLNISVLYKLVSRIRSLAFNQGMTLIIQSHMDPDSEDEKMNNLAQSISSCSDVWIDCQKLVTGFSQTIDGSLDIKDHANILGNKLMSRYHFKTMERNTKIFVPGSSR